MMKTFAAAALITAAACTPAFAEGCEERTNILQVPAVKAFMGNLASHAVCWDRNGNTTYKVTPGTRPAPSMKEQIVAELFHKHTGHAVVFTPLTHDPRGRGPVMLARKR